MVTPIRKAESDHLLAGCTVRRMSDPWGPTQPGRARRANRRPRWLFPLLAAIVLIGAGSAVGVYLLTSKTDIVDMLSPNMTVTGTVTLDLDNMTNSGTACWGKRGFTDLKAGAPVVVTDAAGKTVGMGALDPGKEIGGRCVLSFKVKDVPKGSDFYGVAVTHRGVVQFSADDVKQPVSLSLR
jgi:hypothetical protein